MSNTDFDPAAGWQTYDPSQGYGAYGSQPPAYGYDGDFFKQRGMPNATLQGPFGDRLQRAVTDAEAATGAKGSFSSGYRDQAEQARLYQNYQNGTGGLAAAPGMSRHQYGAAADLNAGPVRDWVRANAGNYGLETIRNDTPHIQIASADYNRTAPQGGPQGAPMADQNGGGPDYGAMMQAMAVNPQDDFSNRLQRAAIFLQGISNPSALSALGAANKDAEQRNQMMMHLMGMKQSSDQHAAQMAQQQQFHQDTLAENGRRDDRQDALAQKQIDAAGWKQYMDTAPKSTLTGKPVAPGTDGGAGGWGQASPEDLAGAQAAAGMNTPNGSLPTPSGAPDLSQAYGQADSPGPALQAVQAAQAVGPQGVMGGLAGAGGWGKPQGAPQGPAGAPPAPPAPQAPPQAPSGPQGSAGAPQAPPGLPPTTTQPKAGPGVQPDTVQQLLTMTPGDWAGMNSKIANARANGMSEDEALNRIHDPGLRHMVQGAMDGGYDPAARDSATANPLVKQAVTLAQSIRDPKAIKQAWDKTQQQDKAYQSELDPTNRGSVVGQIQQMGNITSTLFGPGGIAANYDKLNNAQIGSGAMAHGFSFALPFTEGTKINVPGVNNHYGPSSDAVPGFNNSVKDYSKAATTYDTNGRSGGTGEERGVNPESMALPFRDNMQPNEFHSAFEQTINRHVAELNVLQKKGAASLGAVANEDGSLKQDSNGNYLDAQGKPLTGLGQERTAALAQMVTDSKNHLQHLYDNWAQSHPLQNNMSTWDAMKSAVGGGPGNTPKGTPALPATPTASLLKLSGGPQSLLRIGQGATP